MKKIELINLTLDEIRRAGSIIEDVRNTAVWHDHVSPDTVKKQIIAGCTEQLEQTRLQLRNILEEVTEFVNGHDMLCGVDCAVSKVAFDLIYERVTDEDFE